MTTSDTDRRRGLTRAALDLLEEQGPEAMTTRKTAARFGASSMSVYSEFGSMGALVASVVAEGFSQLGEVLSEVPETTDPVADLWTVGLAYRDFAVRRPHLYGVMFSISAAGGYRRTGTELLQGFDTFEQHVAFVSRAIDLGRLRREDPLQVGLQLWSTLHGFVMLELSGHLVAVPDPVTSLLAPLFVTAAVGLGAEPVAARHAVG